MPILLGIATLVFIASSAILALQMARPVLAPLAVETAGLLTPQLPDLPITRQVSLSDLLLHPHDLGTRGLLLATWAALAYHALRRLYGQPQQPGGMHHRAPADAPLVLGLLLGAVWPWLAQDHSLIAFVMALAMLGGFLIAALCRPDGQPPRDRRSSALGFVAGWALLACLSIFASMMQERLGVPQTAAAALAVLIVALAAVSIQLRLGRRIGFSLAVLWGLIGIAAGTVALDASIAMATVLTISIIAVGLVRVTT